MRRGAPGASDFGAARSVRAPGAGDLEGDGSVVLTFSASGAWVAGESWRVVVGSGTAAVIPDTVCDVAEADLSLVASGAYSADRSTELLVEIAPAMTAAEAAAFCAPLAVCGGAEEGRSQFAWRLNEPGTSFAGPFPIVEGVAIELALFTNNLCKLFRV